MRAGSWLLPTSLAILLTLANAVKPVVVDDTAYLLFARQIAAHPLDPYGFDLFWYDRPEPAMTILAPPVLPYWLAAGVALFGENLFLLKLWLFPIALAFAHSAAFLLRRFAQGAEHAGLVMLVFSPAVLPLFSFMLDVPAVALGLTAVALFIRGCDRVGWTRAGLVAAAGAFACLAVQTKYTMMTVPAVFVWYGLMRGHLRAALAASAIGVALFAGWECFLAQTYGVSHFVFHVRAQQSSGDSGISAWIDKKSDLVNPLLGYVGGLAAAWGLYAGRAVGFPRWFVAVVGLVVAAGYAVVCVVPYSESVLLLTRAGHVRLDLPMVVFYSVGASVFGTFLIAAALLGFRFTRDPMHWLRRDADTWFLLGWLGIELAAYFVLTPFPAGRRVISVCVLLGFVACRLVSRMRRVRPSRAPERWIVAYGVAAGLGLFALDAWDALPERELAVWGAAETHGPGQVWTQGHWGWQYYCDRLGMRLVEPGQSHLHKGDWLVFPVIPDNEGFYRPYHGQATFKLDPDALDIVNERVWDDRLAAQTIPNLYGDVRGLPVVGRDHPRLRVRVYRVTRDWVPTPE